MVYNYLHKTCQGKKIAVFSHDGQYGYGRNGWSWFLVVVVMVRSVRIAVVVMLEIRYCLRSAVVEGGGGTNAGRWWGMVLVSCFLIMFVVDFNLPKK